MKTIIAIWGTGEIEITAVIGEAYKKMMRVVTSVPLTLIENEFRAVVAYNNKKIGLFCINSHDLNPLQNIESLAAEKCDIIICASRAQSSVVEYVKKIARKYEYRYEIIWTSYFSGGIGKKPAKMMYNEVFSNALKLFVDNCIIPDTS